MIKIKFLDAQEVEDGEGIVYQSFRAGQVIELNNAAARFWLSRGLAIDVQGGKLPSVGPRGPQSKSEEGRFNDKSAKKAAETEADPEDPYGVYPKAVEETPEPEKVEATEEKAPPKTGKTNPTSPKRGRGRPRSASRPDQA